MKIGISIPHMGSIANPENIAYAARFADSEGFDSIWVIDRLLWPSEPQTPYPPSPDGSWPEVYQQVYDPIETLSYVAAVTQRIKLATGIIDMLYQNPLILANRIATLDQLSKGRLMLGLGLGHSKDEFDASGVSFENRGKRADEYLEVLNKVWYDDTVEHKGEFYIIPRSIVAPKPYQKKIPIYLAGFAPKALKRIITSNVDGWAAIPQLDLNGFKQGRDYLKEIAKQNDRDPETVEFPSLVFPEVTEEDLGSDRQLMNGSVSQIAWDLQQLEKEGINHVNLVFDFSSHANDLKKRLDYAKQIKDALIPSVLTPQKELNN